MEELSVPVMLRNARKAISARNYGEAALLYTRLMAREEMADNFDIRVRHAYCVDKTGHTNQAITLYKGIAEHYRSVGEDGAAKNIEQTIEELETSVKEKLAAARAEAERVKAEKAKIAQAEIERLRREKEREEQLRVEREIEALIRAEEERKEALRLEKERQEKEAQELIIQEQKARKALLRKKKAEAEKVRSARFQAKKTDTLTGIRPLATGAFELAAEEKADDEEELLTFDISDSVESEFEKPDEPWLG
jgi:membrane protein involved in colicin uptake